MTAISRALKAAYNFLAGDVILLAATVAAFIAGLLGHAVAAPNPLVAVLFVACIIAGLALTLGRELRGRARRR
jgi:membrane protein implicated in regulation of membrane protease activity